MAALLATCCCAYCLPSCVCAAGACREALASNLGSLVRQHAVFVQLELDDVLMLCGRQETTAAAAGAGAGAATAGGAVGGGGGVPRWPQSLCL